MADPVAMMRAASASVTNTQKMKGAMEKMWNTRTQLRAANDNAIAFEVVLRQQIDEVNCPFSPSRLTN
jgi:hypothetical protein